MNLIPHLYIYESLMTALVFDTFVFHDSFVVWINENFVESLQIHGL